MFLRKPAVPAMTSSDQDPNMPGKLSIDMLEREMVHCSWVKDRYDIVLSPIRVGRPSTWFGMWPAKRDRVPYHALGSSGVIESIHRSVAQDVDGDADADDPSPW
jgi:hypothetical protein